MSFLYQFLSKVFYYLFFVLWQQDCPNLDSERLPLGEIK